MRTTKKDEIPVSKRVVGLLLFAMLLALRFPAEAQQPTKIPRIGVLYTGMPGVTTLNATVFLFAFCQDTDNSRTDKKNSFYHRHLERTI